VPARAALRVVARIVMLAVAGCASVPEGPDDDGLLASSAVVAALPLETGDRVEVGRFSAAAPGGALPAGWEPYRVLPQKLETRYRLVENAGVVVLEELEHAKARGAKIYAEVTGYAATSDGADMVAPSGEGAVRCMQQALSTLDSPIDYINTHGTSTPAGDFAELDAMSTVFEGAVPPFSSSKSLCGHSLGATGVQEAIHCLLMLEQGFMAGSANIFELDPKAQGLPVLLETREAPGLKTVMTNNFGFGGTNASLVFQRFSGQ